MDAEYRVIPWNVKLTSIIYLVKAIPKNVKYNLFVHTGLGRVIKFSTNVKCCFWQGLCNLRRMVRPGTLYLKSNCRVVFSLSFTNYLLYMLHYSESYGNIYYIGKIAVSIFWSSSSIIMTDATPSTSHSA